MKAGPTTHARVELRRRRLRRLRRRGRRAYIRSVYFLPSLATLGNVVCGFGAMYVAALDPAKTSVDVWTNSFSQNHFAIAAYLIFAAMVFDALDGRLARYTRHTTDFGGQLDSLADVISFGAAPAFLALQVVKEVHPSLDPALSRMVWAVGALYVSCAALRLARFNVSNQHGEQHHFSFLGLPSPGAAGTVAAFVLLQREFYPNTDGLTSEPCLTAQLLALAIPFIVALTALMMVSSVRYAHVVNRYLRGRRSMGRLLVVLMIALLMVVAFKYTLAIGLLLYALSGPLSWTYAKLRARPTPVPAPPTSQPK